MQGATTVAPAATTAATAAAVATATRLTTATAAAASHRQLVGNRCLRLAFVSRTSIEDATKMINQQTGELNNDLTN